MQTTALLMMVGTNLIVAGVTFYFFYKVFTTPTPGEILDKPKGDDVDFPRGG